jgi:hypothetical protein
MIHNLFSTPIYKINILDALQDMNKIETVVREKLQSSMAGSSSLEKNGGISTY